MAAEKLKNAEIRELLTTLQHDGMTAPAAGGAHAQGRPRRGPLFWSGALLLGGGWVAAALLLMRPEGAVAEVARPAPAAAASPSVAAANAAPVTKLAASGYVVATRHATVSSETTGRLAHVYTREGALVKKGELLADLDPGNVLTQIALAEAELAAARTAAGEARVQHAEARRQLERTRVLVAQGFVSRQQLDADNFKVALLEAQNATRASQVEVAAKRVHIQRRYLENTRILAPFDGLVVEQPAQVGEIVSPISAGGGFTRTGIATLLDTESLAVEVNVSEQYIGQVRKGQPVTVRMQAYPDLALKGEVSTVMAAASRDTAAVKVQIAFHGHDPRVLPNMGANVSFE